MRDFTAHYRCCARPHSSARKVKLELDVIWISNERELPQAVNDLMHRGAKLLVPSGTSASVAAKSQVSTIPIVFINVGNPIGVGLVESLAHPGAGVLAPTSADRNDQGRLCH